jgi:CheY-like chemotaxis protein
METTPYRILLADDDEGDRLLFVEVLEELHIKPVIDTVSNGVQLMELLTKNQPALPDLLFLDLNMPRKNGMECLREIRSKEEFKPISIVIYSTSSAQNDIDETLKNGADFYITKPNNFEILRKVLTTTVIKFIENRHIEKVRHRQADIERTSL